MEVNYEEYQALKRRVEELERAQTARETPMAAGWSYVVTEQPINSVALVDRCSMDEPSVCYQRGTRDAWKLLTGLAKMLHRKDTFHFRRYHCANGNHYWERKMHDAPRTYAALTYEEKLLSLEMLNELVPIFNKYYKIAHPEASFYDSTGKVFSLQVIDENELQ